MNGLSHVNVELTSRCNKSCAICGRRKREREHPELCNYGDMDLDMVGAISSQLPGGVFVQLHNNGEPLLYPYLRDALRLFEWNYTGFDTNGILILERMDEIIDLLNTITFSVVANDEHGKKQFNDVSRFLALKGARKPLTTIRFSGDIEPDREMAWEDLANHFSIQIARRILHAKEMSREYQRRPVVPEIGVCLEILHKLSIDRFGNVSPCVRFDPEGINRLGNVAEQSLHSIWNGKKRREWVDYHLAGLRHNVPLCAICEYWGIPQ